MSYINVLPRIKQWICPKQWASSPQGCPLVVIVQGIVNTADFQLSGQSTSEMFPFNPAFKLKLDPLCSSYSLPHPHPESALSLLRVSCGSITGQFLISIAYSARNSWVHPQAQSRSKLSSPHWAHDQASALPELAPHSQDLLWLTTLQSCRQTPHPSLFFFPEKHHWCRYNKN